MKAFSSDNLALIDAAEEVEIETGDMLEGQSHRAVIWVVVEGGDVFVRSVRGTRGRWFRELTANGQGFLHVGGQAIAVRATPASDPTSVERCSRGLGRKYTNDASLRSMLRADVLPTTLRLEPR